MAPPIPFFDYRPLYRRLQREIDAAVARVLASGRLILGPEGEAFEKSFAKWHGGAHAVGVASGTDALILAFRALEIGAGDEVVTVANAGAPPVAAIRAVGARPHFVDIDATTMQLDPGALSDACGPRTQAVLAVHLYGHAAPLGPIGDFARERGLRVVEDCAQALGTVYDGRPVGTFGDVACFSFYPTKNIGAFGDGGLCLTANATIAERLRQLRMYGFGDDDRVAHHDGLNSRLDELQAAILRVKLAHLDSILEERRALARTYREGLQRAALRLPPLVSNTRDSHHLFVIRSERRAVLRESLVRRSVATGIHYAVPAHRMPAYAALAAGVVLPATDRACETVLSLPLYNGMSDEDVQRVVAGLVAAI